MTAAAKTPAFRFYKNLAEIREANRVAGMHWFSPDTLRFFGTRMCAHGRIFGGRYFVTSEYVGFDRRGPRRYSVRVAGPDGAIDTVGDFGAYASRNGAIAAAKRL